MWPVMPRIDANGATSASAPGRSAAASAHVGPVPIERPKMTTRARGQPKSSTSARAALATRRRSTLGRAARVHAVARVLDRDDVDREPRLALAVELEVAHHRRDLADVDRVRVRVNDEERRARLARQHEARHAAEHREVLREARRVVARRERRRE